MEATDNHMLETVALYPRPVLHLVGRNVFRVAGHIVAGIGIGALGTDGGHQLVILIRDIVAGSQLRHRVYLMVCLPALVWVGKSAVHLVTTLYIVEQRALLLIISGAKLLRTLKHQVLQIVSQSRCLCRIIARTGLHCDVSLYTRLLLVHTQIHRQSVVELIDAALHGVTFHHPVMILLGQHPSRQQEEEGNNQKHQETTSKKASSFPPSSFVILFHL